MGKYGMPSRCGSKQALTFRWYGYPQCAAEDDNLKFAVDVLMDKLSPKGRLWSPHAVAMTRSELRSRIRKASLGQLVPVDEVKAVDENNPPPLYEIRWQGISVLDREPDGTERHHNIKVRMYHSEPTELPGHFIGHHGHEKDLDAEDINAAQDLEIAVALGWYQHGQASKWGIAE
ncbi:hypothetical protein [Arthrobacter woluwensis]|uniref:hypothetical protein n=1 Tax=Arthrobacter woluwensis TaxID=156980 RepID=UPI001AAF1B00|nr:hypothetical protein [Arthrobacter woluwensis]QTF71245.1 hypothetical protein G8758_03915 [Arthrobacter woluwensis]